MSFLLTLFFRYIFADRQYIFRIFWILSKFLSHIRRAMIMKNSFMNTSSISIDSHHHFFTFSRSHEKIWIGRYDIFKDSIFFLLSFIFSWSWARHQTFHEWDFNRQLKKQKIRLIKRHHDHDSIFISIVFWHPLRIYSSDRRFDRAARRKIRRSKTDEYTRSLSKSVSRTFHISKHWTIKSWLITRIRQE